MQKVRFGLLFLLATFIQYLNADSLYVWTDEYGNKVYSDKLPNKVKRKDNYKIITQKEVATVEWNLARPVLIKTSKTKKIKHSDKRKKETCQQLKVKIDKTTNQLKKRLKTEKFDQAKMNLSKYRREYRKKCV